ncbi:hypothetical protein EUGRSUZ_F04199 [Eucalyptus grandis]|uniref:Uncharacterized protein n=2 Tax=Eucalyptus grandis TaxID=71139 RepID=A0ACC3KPY2_EUCGR|nr:hypothetical protein EUGRSUZ_F04199 [Eucalyptus grandis]
MSPMRTHSLDRMSASELCSHALEAKSLKKALKPLARTARSVPGGPCTPSENSSSTRSDDASKHFCSTASTDSSPDEEGERSKWFRENTSLVGLIGTCMEFTISKIQSK